MVGWAIHPTSQIYAKYKTLKLIHRHAKNRFQNGGILTMLGCQSFGSMLYVDVGTEGSLGCLGRFPTRQSWQKLLFSSFVLVVM